MVDSEVDSVVLHLTYQLFFLKIRHTKNLCRVCNTFEVSNNKYGTDYRKWALSPQQFGPSSCGWRKGSWEGRRVAANILNKQSHTADKLQFSSLGVGGGTNNSSP
jgi:hypothetical protein